MMPRVSAFGAGETSPMKELPYRVEKLNTLAFPKGQHPRCELTGLPATVQCITPHITLYYSTKDQAEEAWHGIVHKIAPLLAPLRAAPLVIGTEEDRAKQAYTMEMNKKALIDICTREAAKFLVKHQFELALPGAMQALKFLKEIYGEESVETIASHLQLAEANLGLSRHRQAEACLARANSSISKNPDCSNNLRSQLHRNYGKLYFSQNKLDSALAELSHGIYFSSLEVGPEHIETSISYYHVGMVFYAQHKIENALAFYDKVVDVWYKFLKCARSDAQLAAAVNDSQLHDATEILDHILKTRVKLLGDSHIASGEAKYTMGLLNLILSRGDEARAAISAAFAIYNDHLGPDHPSTIDIKSILDSIPSHAADRIVAFADDDDAADTLQDTNFDTIDAHFPANMPRAAPQSPIPQVPESAGL